MPALLNRVALLKQLLTQSAHAVVFREPNLRAVARLGAGVVAGPGVGGEFIYAFHIPMYFVFLRVLVSIAFFALSLRTRLYKLLFRHGRFNFFRQAGMVLNLKRKGRCRIANHWIE